MGRLPNELHSRPDLHDICEELDLAPASKLLFGGCLERLRDLLWVQPSAVLVRDAMGKTPLHWAARLRNDEAIDMLIEAGADIDAVGHDGTTPLYDALRGSHVSRTTCIRMIQAGSDVNHITPYGKSPLTTAVGLSSCVPVIDILLDAGANVHHVCNGLHLLQIAAKNSTRFVCEELLYAGVDIDAQTPIGQTAVMTAVRHNNHSVLELLIYHGAQLDTLTFAGFCIVEYAAFYGDIETMQILEQACIEGLQMDETAQEYVWACFDERDLHIYPQDREPLQAEEAALQALIDSIIPTQYATLDDAYHRDSDAFHIPGAFPTNPTEADYDSRIAEGQEEDDDDGYEEKRDSDDESWVTTNGDCSDVEEEMETASDDEVDESI